MSFGSPSKISSPAKCTLCRSLPADTAGRFFSLCHCHHQAIRSYRILTWCSIPTAVLTGVAASWITSMAPPAYANAETHTNILPAGGNPLKALAPHLGFIVSFTLHIVTLSPAGPEPLNSFMACRKNDTLFGLPWIASHWEYVRQKRILRIF